MTHPLQMSLDVHCPTERAFELWTSRIDSWWPSDHSVTGRADIVVVLEPGIGGRIFERTPEGVEHDWGEVTVWEPPRRLSYLWHLHRDRADATEVDIRFSPDGDDSTHIEIEHRGWDRLGGDGDLWRRRNQLGWDTLLPYLQTAIREERDR
jgi:uncharacterized protein YndB with AHSA1/START domain